MNKEEIINFYLENDILISPEVLNRLGNEDLYIPITSKFSVINSDVLEVHKNKLLINIADYEKSRVQKERYKNSKLYDKFVEYIVQHNHDYKPVLFKSEESKIIQKEVFDVNDILTKAHKDLDISKEILKTDISKKDSILKEKFLDNHHISSDNFSSSSMSNIESNIIENIKENFIDKKEVLNEKKFSSDEKILSDVENIINNVVDDNTLDDVLNNSTEFNYSKELKLNLSDVNNSYNDTSDNLLKNSSIYDVAVVINKDKNIIKDKQTIKDNFSEQSKEHHIDIKTLDPDSDRYVKPIAQTESLPNTESEAISNPIMLTTPESVENEERELREEFMKKNRIKIVSSYSEKSKKRSVQDFVAMYNARYKELERILRSRTELQGLTSISRITQKKERENISMIGVVYEKGVTKTKNFIITLEDPTGMVKAIVRPEKEELFRLCDELQLDEVIGVTGVFDTKYKMIFVNNIFIPDIPLSKELKKTPEEGYIVVISDPQVGNKLFLEKEFTKFLMWINGEMGNDKQKDIASKVKYIFLPGDLVDGVGIYPNQEYDLTIIDIKDQYKALANYIKQIPEYIPIIFCLGNHDEGRISEPQPPLQREYGEDLLKLPNLIAVSNPSIVNVFASPENNFDGFDVMMYHGGSFVYYSANIPNIRKTGAQKRPDLIAKYLLQRRHLAPTHTATLYIPDAKIDPLVISKVPDFLLSGHIHRTSVSNYRNVTCINASCWVSKSDEQERRGLEPQPGRAFIINMQTREVKIMNFLSKEDQAKESPDYSQDKDLA